MSATNDGMNSLSDLQERYSDISGGQPGTQANRYFQYFGPAGNLTQPNAYDKLSHATRDLPDIYKGVNLYLRDTIDGFVFQDNEWYTTVCLPWLLTDQHSIAFNTYEFSNTLVGQVPHQGISRLLTHKNQKFEDQVVRKGIAFVMEGDLAGTDEGDIQYIRNIMGISQVCQESQNHDVLYALLNCKNYEKDWRKRFDAGRSDPAQVRREEVANFAAVSTDPDRLDILIDEYARLLAQEGIRADLLILWPGASNYLRDVTWGGRTQFYQLGEQGALNLMDGPEPRTIYKGMAIFEARDFTTESNGANIQLLERNISAGEYYSMCFGSARSLSAHHYRTPQRDIRMYDFNANDWVTISFRQAFLNTRLTDGSGKNWAPAIEEQLRADQDALMRHPKQESEWQYYRNYEAQDNIDSSELPRRHRFMFSAHDTLHNNLFVPKIMGQFDVDVINSKDFEQVGQSLASRMFSDDYESTQMNQQISQLMQLLRDIENEPYDESYFKSLIEANISRSAAANGTWYGELSPQGLVRDFVPNAEGGLDLPQKLASTGARYPAGYANWPGLKVLASQASNKGWNNDNIQKRAQSAVDFVKLLTARLNKYVPMSMLLDPDSAPDWFHNRSESELSVFTNMLHINRDPIWLMKPAGYTAQAGETPATRTTKAKSGSEPPTYNPGFFVPGTGSIPGPASLQNFTSTLPMSAWTQSVINPFQGLTNSAEVTASFDKEAGQSLGVTSTEAKAAADGFDALYKAVIKRGINLASTSDVAARNINDANKLASDVVSALVGQTKPSIAPFVWAATVKAILKGASVQQNASLDDKLASMNDALADNKTKLSKTIASAEKKYEKTAKDSSAAKAIDAFGERVLAIATGVGVLAGDYASFPGENPQPAQRGRNQSVPVVPTNKQIDPVFTVEKKTQERLAAVHDEIQPETQKIHTAVTNMMHYAVMFHNESDPIDWEHPQPWFDSLVAAKQMSPSLQKTVQKAVDNYVEAKAIVDAAFERNSEAQSSSSLRVGATLSNNFNTGATVNFHRSPLTMSLALYKSLASQQNPLIRPSDPATAHMTFFNPFPGQLDGKNFTAIWKRSEYSPISSNAGHSAATKSIYNEAFFQNHIQSPVYVNEDEAYGWDASTPAHVRQGLADSDRITAGHSMDVDDGLPSWDSDFDALADRAQQVGTHFGAGAGPERDFAGDVARNAGALRRQKREEELQALRSKYASELASVAQVDEPQQRYEGRVERFLNTGRTGAVEQRADYSVSRSSSAAAQGQLLDPTSLPKRIRSATHGNNLPMLRFAEAEATLSLPGGAELRVRSSMFNVALGAMEYRWQQAGKIQNPVVRAATYAAITMPNSPAAWMNLIDNDVHVPANILVWRLWITNKMCSAIMMVGGYRTGGTVYGHSNFSQGADTVSKIIYGNFTFKSKSMVWSPKSVVHMPNIKSAKHVGGWTTQFIKGSPKKLFMDIRRAHDMRTAPSCLATIIPITENRHTEPISFLTHMNAGSSWDAPIDGQAQNYSSASYYERVFKDFVDASHNNKNRFTYFGPRNRTNVTAYVGTHFTYDANTNALSNEKNGNGHFSGNRTGPGVADVWDGMKNMFPPRNASQVRLH